jgi:two-component system chemotaxis response regulator CheY
LEKGYFEDLLGQLEPLALDLDRTGDSSKVHLLFRLVHNLKSSVAQEGLVALATEVHQLEDILDRIRRGKETWNWATCDLVMQVIDQVRKAMDMGAQILEFQPVVATAQPASDWGLPLTAAEADAANLAVNLGKGLYRIEKLFRRGLSEEVFKALPVLEDIHELGTLIAQHPSWQGYQNGPEEQVVKFLFASSHSEAELAAVIFDPLLVLQAPLAVAAPPARESLRFLVVEDEPTVAGLLNFILRKHGECTVCSTGAEGLDYFRACWEQGEPLDLVVLDLFLPDRPGDEVLREIRNYEARRGIRPPDHHCHVLLNTASRDLDRMKQALAMEPDGYLLKPLNVELMLEAIEKLKGERLAPAR